MRLFIFDKIMAFLGLVILSPLMLMIAIAIVTDSSGGVFFVQSRVGKHRKSFGMVKFRTMVTNSERNGKITIGARDPRITHVGYGLRKYKLDELPQLFNVLNGTMNLVGPRPEVPEYVAYYSDSQLKVLEVKPGITDYASLQYFDESELLAQSANPKQTYTEVVLPAKLALNLAYLEKRSFGEDLKIIGMTIKRILVN